MEFFLFKFVYLVLISLLFCTSLFSQSIQSKNYVKKLYIPKSEISKIDKTILTLYKKGDCEKAYTLMQKTRTHNANNFYYHYIYAQCASKLKRYGEAAGGFERALILKNDIAGVRFELAKMYLKLSNFIEAQILIANMIEYASNPKIREDLKYLLTQIDKRNQDHYFKLDFQMSGGTDSNIINQAHDQFYIYPNWQYFSDSITIANTKNGSFGAYTKGTQVKATIADKSSPYHAERFSIGYIYNKVGSYIYARSKFAFLQKEANAANYKFLRVAYDASVIFKTPTLAIGGDYVSSLTLKNENSLKKDLKHSGTVGTVRVYYSFLGDEKRFTIDTTSSSNLRGVDKIATTSSTIGLSMYNSFFDGMLSNTLALGVNSEKVKVKKMSQMFRDDPNSFYVNDDISHSGTSMSGGLIIKATSKTSFFGNIAYNARVYTHMNWLYSEFNDVVGGSERYQLIREVKRSDTDFDANMGFSHLFGGSINFLAKFGYKVNKSNIPLYKYEKTFLEVSVQRSFDW